MKKGRWYGFLQRWRSELLRLRRLGRSRVFGAPLYWRWSVLGVFLLQAWLTRRHPETWPIVAGGWIAILFVHECGHAFVARRLGYEVTAISFGALHGSCEHEAPEYEAHEIAIAWGGVGAQVALAIVPFMLHTALGTMPPPLVRLLLAELSYVNILVALFNLLPIPGFDGHTAWRAIPLGWQMWRSRLATRRVIQGLGKPPKRHLRVVKNRDREES